MCPIALWIRDGGELAVIHRCERCGTLRSNRIAGDDDPRVIQALLVETMKHAHAMACEEDRHDQP